VLSARELPDRDAYDTALVALLRDARVDLVCLAGFMRLVGAPMLAAFPDLKRWDFRILATDIDTNVIARAALGVYPEAEVAGLSAERAGPFERLGKLERVKYVSIKPPHAWSGTPAETDFDLPSIKEPTVIFQGTPADAGRLYPKNANLAVTVALCGAGLDRTEIELVADPTLPPGTNASRLEVISDSGELRLERLGKSMPDNPKTGVLTALTMADDLMKIVRSSDW